MPHDIANAETYHFNPLNAFELGNGIVQPRHMPRRQIALLGVAAHDHAAVLAETGQEHLHLRGRRVLRFVENDEGFGQRPPAHERDRRDFDFTAGNAPLDLLGGQAIIERIVNRAQVRIDLFLHVARQEPEPLARFDRGARQDQPVDRSRDQLRHSLRHREIGLPRPRWPQRKDDVVAIKRFHIADLHRRARNNRFLARADHHRRGLGHVMTDDPVERGFG